MTDVHLTKLFAWVIGVLILLWLLAECLGGPNDRTDPDRVPDERDAEVYAADCQAAWYALDLLGDADHDNISVVVDEIEDVAAGIQDPELASLAYSFGPRAEDLVANTESGDQERLDEAYQLYRSLVEVDLSLRCAGVGSN